jgi:hypothetical protein
MMTSNAIEGREGFVRVDRNRLKSRSLIFFRYGVIVSSPHVEIEKGVTRSVVEARGEKSSARSKGC